MQETTNLKLRKPEYNEYADVMDINHNMDILDEEVNKKLDKTKKAADSEKLDGLDSLMFVRSYSSTNNDFIPKEIFNNPAHNQSYMGVINYGTEVGLPFREVKITFFSNNIDGFGTQIAVPCQDGKVYGIRYRNAVGKTWGEWLEILDTRDRNATDPTTIAPNNDTNNCLETGKAYYCIWNQTAHLPFGTRDDGIIIPYMHIKGQFGFQKFMTWNGTSIWWRKLHNGNWSKWYCIGGGSWNQEIQKDSEQVVKYQRWANYGQNHVIFDASKGIRPDGQACNNINSTHAWQASYPILMGFNGGDTFGLKVDKSRDSDCVAGFQFRNNNGILEVLINGVWMAVGGQIYNRILTTTGGGIYNSTIIKPFGEARNGIQNEYQEGQEVVIIDWRKPSKILSCSISNMNVGSNMGYGYQGIRLASIKVYYDDVLVHDIPIGNDLSLFNRIDGAYIEVRKGFKIIGRVSKQNSQAVHPQVGINALYYEG